MSDALIFIYNAAGGKLSTALDIAHKIVSPSTYQCDLCALTHGVFSERSEWTAFKQRSAYHLEFYHKDEWSKNGGEAYTYPVILRRTDGAYTVLMTAAEIASQSDVAMLIDCIEQRLQKER